VETPGTVRVLGISGSLRADSYNTQLLHTAGELLPESVELDFYAELAGLPPYDQDVEDDGAPAPVQDLRDRLRAADALLIATPEYNGSFPGVLKNAIDWSSRPRDGAALANKPVAVIGASLSAFGGVWAQADTRKVLGIAGARVIEGEVVVAHAPEHFAGGRLVDPDIRAQLGELLRRITEQLRLADAA
jgi:chromate reductase